MKITINAEYGAEAETLAHLINKLERIGLKNIVIGVKKI